MDTEQILNELTLEEKITLLRGMDLWHTASIERLGIKSIMVTDGPNGLRKASGFIANEAVPATCFPTSCAMAASWDTELLQEIGNAMAEECIAEDVAVILGPGVNIKRSPLCGRNFEYYSEDPLLAGLLGAALIRGVEEKGIGTSLKHFAANNQERMRLVSNSVIDERTLREIYLKPFEIAVKNARPSTVMCSYNMINGTYACQNKRLLNDILRSEWGFEGFVMTDWGAMDDPVEAVKAGLDLEMPGPAISNMEKMIKAVEEGRLSEETINESVRRILSFILSHQERVCVPYDKDNHHALAKRASASSSVLLENRDSLPLRRDGYYAVIGSFAEKPRFEGSGSSKVNANKVDNVLSTLDEMGIRYVYAPGYDRESGESSEEMMDEALSITEGKDGVIVFIGLTENYESEGFDRTSMELPPSHVELVERLVEKHINVNVVLASGAPVLLPFKDKVSSLLLTYLGGEAVGSAVVDILFGSVNPSGRLPETFPLSLEDNPSYGNFATASRDVEYKEGLFVGYRYYETKDIDVAYPFGYGLSYTTFTYKDIEVEKRDDKVEVSVTVSNSGSADGHEVIQLYVGMKTSRINRAVRELRAFRKIFLEKGESARLLFSLDSSAFSYYDTATECFEVEEGDYEISFGRSSRDMIISKGIHMEGIIPEFETVSGKKMVQSGTLTSNSPVFEVLSTEGGKQVLGTLFASMQEASAGDSMFSAMLPEMPIRALFALSDSSVDPDDLIAKINAINEQKTE